MNVVADAIETVIGLAAMMAVPAYFVLQPWLGLRLTGGWKIAALAPLLPAVPLLLWCLVAFADQSNLWPLPFILFAPFATVYLLIVFGLNLATRRA